MTTDLTPGIVLRRAGEVITTNGRYVGSYHDWKAEARDVPAEQCAVCIVGAINIAAGLRPDMAWPEERPGIGAKVRVARSAGRALADVIGGYDGRDNTLIGFLADWHDGRRSFPTPTDAEVLAKVAEAADLADSR
ncbi:DUF6197 family protein [Nonomuraea basaltis]|uniref:DUF6197 family protein n=1 Tax=Nonomuraea basaltis TaxID=2495887 RepID=UPI00110C67B7|nr:hypothetical protein [Nonomuraea basaltis]TMR89495.1 hypothetical protein EJK15_60465 [Nonomuraea basaltis]